jgi:hypothetical protein
MQPKITDKMKKRNYSQLMLGTNGLFPQYIQECSELMYKRSTIQEKRGRESEQRSQKGNTNSFLMERCLPSP